MDGLNHSEAVTIFAKCCAEVIGREKRELIVSLVRQTGYDIEEKHVLTIPKAPNQQVGVKLYNVVDRVVIYDVVPGRKGFIKMKIGKISDEIKSLKVLRSTTNAFKSAIISLKSTTSPSEARRKLQKKSHDYEIMTKST